MLSPILNIIDDGTLRESPFSVPFDLEGVATRAVALVNNGRVENLLYDSYEGTRENQKSTGSFHRSPFEAWPKIRPTNFFVKPAQESVDLWSGVSGLWIDDFLEVGHVPGQPGKIMLRGICGPIESGEPTMTRHEIFICIELVELLRKAVSVGNDLTYFGQFGAPSILFDKVPLELS